MYQRIPGKTQPGETQPPRKTRAILRDPSEWLTIEVPSLIDEATYNAVQEQLERNRALGQRRRKYEYLFLAGTLRCGRCGTPMSGYTTQNGHRRYRCRRLSWQITETDQPRCLGSVHAETIETYVWEAVEDAIRDPKRLHAEIARQHANIETQREEVTRERRLLDTALARCDRDLKRWEDAYLAEALTVEDYKSKKAEVEARRNSLHAEQRRLDERVQGFEQNHLDIRATEAVCRDLAQNLDPLNIDKKRRALETFKIIVTSIPGQWPPHIEGQILVRTASMASS